MGLISEIKTFARFGEGVTKISGRGPPQIPELEGGYRQSGNAAQLCSDLGTLSFVLLHV